MKPSAKNILSRLNQWILSNNPHNQPTTAHVVGAYLAFILGVSLAVLLVLLSVCLIILSFLHMLEGQWIRACIDLICTLFVMGSAYWAYKKSKRLKIPNNHNKGGGCQK